MSEQIICEKCGTQMVPLQEYGSIGMTCPNCGWGWVTTDSERLFDSRKYTITILESGKTNLAAIRAVSKACGCNFMEARDLLVKGCVIPECSSSEARRIIESLNQGNVSFESEPAFTSDENENMHQPDPLREGIKK